MMISQPANLLTGTRILCGLLILVCPAFSGRYYLLYLVGGITDAVDGTVARKLGQESAFGAKLDTAADFVFAISVTVKICVSLHVPLWLTVCIGMIVLMKIGNLIAGYIRYHELITVHSALNRICGVIVFAVPLLIGVSDARQATTVVEIAVYVVAALAAIAERAEIIGRKRKLS